MPKVERRVPMLTDEEEARLQAQIALDPDNPELTDEQLARMRPASEVLSPVLYAALTRERPTNVASRVAVTLSLDGDIVATLEASGPDWQDRVNEVLRAALPTLAKQD